MSNQSSDEGRNQLKGEAASVVFAAPEPAVVNAETAKAGDITWMPGWQIRDLIAEREVSPVEVVKHFLARIEKLDPILHAFSFVDSQGALAQAKQAEKAVLRGERLGPLHGIPIALKSHILVKGYDMQEIWEPERHPGMHDDIGTERLRKAGAIILGHTIYPAMGTGGVPQGGDPIKNLENHPRNPWNPQRVPGSSSAGSAAAAASAMLPFTIGSDGGGSTRLPAALSGVIGVHPSRGRIPFVSYRNPKISETFIYTTIGPMTRNVRDAAMTMQVMAGFDGRDVLCRPEAAPDYLTDLDKGVDGMRFAWTDDFGFTGKYALPESSKVIEMLRNTATGFAGLGARFEITDEKWAESTSGMMPPQTPEARQAALEQRAAAMDQFMRLFERFDLILSPTIQYTAFSVQDWDAAWTSGGATYPGGFFAPTYTAHTAMFNLLGFPALSVPAGFYDKMPIGLQIIGRPDREPQIFRAAAAFLKAYPRNERPLIS